MLILLAFAVLVTALGGYAGLQILSDRLDALDAVVRRLEQAERER